MAWRCAAAAAVAAAIAAEAARRCAAGHEDIKTAFQSENAFYYSFYEQVINAQSWREGFRKLHVDTLSEAPTPINAFRRFNIYQELLFGLLWRGSSWLTPTPLDPVSFYCTCVFAVYGLGLLAMLAAAPRSMWSLLIAGALYYSNLTESSHVSYMPPLRENCGVPLWFASCASLVLLHERRMSSALWPRALLVLSCSGFLLVWQFACFALAMQVSSLYALAVLGVASWPFLVEVSKLYSASAVLSFALRFGDLWVLRSIFFWLSFTVAVVGHLLAGKISEGAVGAPATGAVLIAVFLTVRKCALWAVLLSGESLDDDSHIFEFLAFRLGLRKEALGYHATLYEGQRSFSPPALQDWEQLVETLLLPFAALAAIAVLAAALRAKGEERQELFGQVMLLMLACATAVPFLLMLRYRMLFFPHLALLASCALDPRVWPSAGRRGRRWGRVLAAAALAVAVGRGARGLEERRGAKGMEEEDTAALMQWLRDNTAETDVVVSGMGLSALVRLHAGRGIVCHPHYESVRLRERCFWVDKLYGHRTAKEYHGIILRNVTPGVSGRRVFVALAVQSCNSVDELGRPISDLIEKEAPHRTKQRKTCQLLYEMAAGNKKPKGFAPRYLNRWYAILEVLSSPSSSAAPLQLSLQAQCDVARYFWEEADEGNKAEPHFQALKAEKAGELNVPCICAVSHFWPPEHLPYVHQRALANRTSRNSGAFGCCEQGRKVLKCIESSSKRLMEVGDLASAEAYYRHAVSLVPSNPKSHGFLAFTHVHSGHFLHALERFQLASVLEAERPNPTTLCGEAVAWGGLGHFDRAAAAVHRAQQAGPNGSSCLQMNPGLMSSMGEGLPEGYAELRDAWESYGGGTQGWKSFLQAPAVLKYVRRSFSGQRLLFLGDARQYMPLILQNLRVLRRVHHCNWSAEVWMEAGEVHTLTQEQRDQLASLDGELRLLPSPYAGWRQAFWDWRANLTLQWGQPAGSDVRLRKYALKAVVIMLSGCEVCLFLDADSVPLKSPQRLLHALPEAGGAIAWPDLWDAPTSAELWRTLRVLGKAQESGQFLVKKTGVQVLEALALAALFAVRIDVFLAAIYSPDGHSLVCGYGDKDTFQLAFRLLDAPFSMASPYPAVATTSEGDYVGILQLDERGKALFLHGAWAKGALSQLLQQEGRLRRCDFASEKEAKNLTCTALLRGGSSSVPMERVKCKTLSVPALKRISRALAS